MGTKNIRCLGCNTFRGKTGLTKEQTCHIQTHSQCGQDEKYWFNVCLNMTLGVITLKSESEVITRRPRGRLKVNRREMQVRCLPERPSGVR